MKTFNEFKSQLAEQGTPTGIKLYHTDKEGKESHTVVFTPRDAQQTEKDVKKAGGKTTHRAVMYGKKEGEKVAVKEEVELEEGSENLPGKATHILNKDVRHPDHGIVQNGTVLRKTGEGKYEIRAGRAKGRIVGLDSAHVNKLEEATVDTADIKKKEMISDKDKSTLGKLADLMAKEKAAKLKKEEVELEEAMSDEDKEKFRKTVSTAAKNLKLSTRTSPEASKRTSLKAFQSLVKHGYKQRMGEEVEIDEEITPVQSAAARQKLKQIEKSGVKKSQDLYNKLTRIANAHPVKTVTKEETEMSQMEQYLAAIAGNADFRSALDEKKLTPAELKKREEIAQAMERENPGMDKSKKMAIATAQAKKVAESADDWEPEKDTKEPDANADKELKDKAKKNADDLQKISNAFAKEEVEVLDEMQQGKEYTQKQLSDKIKSGNWEPTTDIKPGKHVEMRHHTGKRVTVKVAQVTEEVEQIDELSKSTLGSYVNKAAKDMADDANASGYKAGSKKKTSIYSYNDSESSAREQKREKGIATAVKKLTKEEAGGDTPDNEKEKSLAKLAKPFDKVTHADVLKGRGVTKEGVEMKTFSQLMAEINEARGDYGWDHPEKDEKPSTTRKVAGTRYGGSAQKDDDNESDDKDEGEKRGRGRPAGSKSGARR